MIEQKPRIKKHRPLNLNYMVERGYPDVCTPDAKSPCAEVMNLKPYSCWIGSDVSPVIYSVYKPVIDIIAPSSVDKKTSIEIVTEFVAEVEKVTTPYKYQAIVFKFTMSHPDQSEDLVKYQTMLMVNFVWNKVSLIADLGVGDLKLGTSLKYLGIGLPVFHAPWIEQHYSAFQKDVTFKVELAK